MKAYETPLLTVTEIENNLPVCAGSNPDAGSIEGVDYTFWNIWWALNS